MFINIDKNLIGRSGRPTPYVGLIESHEIERTFGQTVTTVGERFRIEKVTVDTFDPTRLAANVPRSTYMPRPVFKFHCHAVPKLELTGR